ncbi:hypothetical protein D3C76_1207170 [compost metagenome]
MPRQPPVDLLQGFRVAVVQDRLKEPIEDAQAVSAVDQGARFDGEASHSSQQALLRRIWCFAFAWIKVNVMVGQRGNVGLFRLLARITVQRVHSEIQVRRAVVLLDEGGQFIDPVRVNGLRRDRSVRLDGDQLHIPFRQPVFRVMLQKTNSLLGIAFGTRLMDV